MNLQQELKKEITQSLSKKGLDYDFELTIPPDTKMGDFSLPVFDLAKELKKKPVELAKEILQKVQNEMVNDKSIIEKVIVVGPYVNFFIKTGKLAEIVLKEDVKLKLEKPQKIMVEFAHPNTHKAFHIGHLRNIITGESVVRILEYAGHKVIRANYQGDVGMHIAKCMYAILQIKDFKKETAKLKNVSDRAKFLGKIYAKGSKAFEESKKSKKEIIELNKKIYNQDPSIKEIYKTTRQWSLDYFDFIYKKVDSHFDRFYFESEVYAKGIKIVKEFLDKNVFEVGEKGAIIFPGEKHGLHNRVFINSEGYSTYEAKDMALAEVQFKEHNPDKIIHVVGKEQSEYFKVIFKALEQVLPKSKGKEFHLDYGWVTLRTGKMSSREGKVILGEWLIDEVSKKVAKLMKDSEIVDKQDTIEKITMSAIKYAFLKTGVKNDIKFDLDESISLSGDSGPYLLYIVARIKSILNKAGKIDKKIIIPAEILDPEKQLLLKLSKFTDITVLSAIDNDSSKIARYLFELAQNFNSFYDKCPVLKSTGEQKQFRLQIIKKVASTMQQGLYLLGIDIVEKM